MYVSIKEGVPQMNYITHIDSNGHKQLWVMDEQKGGWILVDERFLSKAISGFRFLNETGRVKASKQLLSQFNYLRKTKAPINCANAESPSKPPTHDSLHTGAVGLLQISALFSSPQSGYRILSDILCGMRCSALRRAEPSFSLVTLISENDLQIEKILRTVTAACVRKKRWAGKRCTLKRQSVLDYRTESEGIPHHFVDFACCKFRVPEYKSLKVPANYVDTIVLIIGANAAQLKEATPYLENAAVLLLNCGASEWNSSRIPRSQLAEFDPNVLKSLHVQAPQIAVALSCWWACTDEDTWAAGIVKAARATFGKPDSRFISAVPEPKRLRDQIRYLVLLSFLYELECNEIMTIEELAPYRNGAKNVFDPEPVPETPTRRAEQPEVFVELMKKIVGQFPEKIVGQSDRFVKHEKKLGARRIIGKVEFLVMPEEIWARTYSQVAKKADGIDCSFFTANDWTQKLQKILCEHDLIKAPSAGYRYRYDLFQNSTKDKTYVIAMPTELL